MKAIETSDQLYKAENPRIRFRDPPVTKSETKGEVNTPPEPKTQPRAPANYAPDRRAPNNTPYKRPLFGNQRMTGFRGKCGNCEVLGHAWRDCDRPLDHARISANLEKQRLERQALNARPATPAVVPTTPAPPVNPVVIPSQIQAIV